MMNTLKTTLFVVCATGLISGTATQAAEANWLGLTNDIIANTNWNSGGTTPYAPATNDFLNINLSGGQRAVVSDGDSFTVGDIRLGNSGSGVTGELEITGGFLRSDRSGGDDRLGFSGNTAIINQSGGLWQVAHQFDLGFGGTGTLNLSGGTLDNQRDQFRVGNSNGTGTVNISGDATLLTRFDARLESSTTSFNVFGGDATIGIGGSASGNGSWIQNSGAVLSYAFDGTDISVIDVSGAIGTATFDAGAVLDLDFTGVSTIVGWSTVMTTDNGITDSGLVLSTAAVTDGWQFRILGNDLQVTNVPEPSAYALLAGCMGLSLVMLRRRKSV